MGTTRGDETLDNAAPLQRSVTYCLIPEELAPKLHELLRRHFRDDPEVEVVVESRWRERRSGKDRRAKKGKLPANGERRLIRSLAGRRAGERRAPVTPLDETPELPRRARAHADRIGFVRRAEPSGQRREDLDTARVVTRFQAGDRDAYNTIYSRYFERVYGYLRMALNDVHEAEDAAQEVFIKVLAGLPDYEPRAQPFRAWLFTLARNHAIDELRRLGRVEPVDPAELAERRESEEAAEDLAAFSALDWIGDRDLLLLFERLPESQRQVLVLRFTLDLSDRQIAAIMERTPSDVRALQYRGLEFLRARLRALGREPKPASRRNQRARTKPAPVLRNRRFSL